MSNKYQVEDNHDAPRFLKKKSSRIKKLISKKSEKDLDILKFKKKIIEELKEEYYR